MAGSWDVVGVLLCNKLIVGIGWPAWYWRGGKAGRLAVYLRLGMYLTVFQRLAVLPWCGSIEEVILCGVPRTFPEHPFFSTAPLKAACTVVSVLLISAVDLCCSLC